MAQWRHLNQDILGLQITVTDVLSVHIVKSIEDLLDKVFDLGHRDRLLRLLSQAQLVFKTALTILHHDILDQSLFLVEAIEELDKLDDIWSPLEQCHHFVLAGDNVTSLLRPLDSHLDISVLVVGFKHESYFRRILMVKNSFSVG